MCRLADRPGNPPSHTDNSRKAFVWRWNLPDNPSQKNCETLSSAFGLPLCLLPTSNRGSLTHSAGTYSFGLGLVGRGGASLPRGGLSRPAVGGESGATWAGLLTSVLGSGCCGGGGGGGGGGDGVAALGELLGEGVLLFIGRPSRDHSSTSLT